MPHFAELLTQLEAAVRTGDRTRALDLARRIEQALDQESYDRADVERRMRELLARLDQAAPAAPLVNLRPMDLLRSEREVEFATGTPEGVVYPVWFGTNRQPDGRGGFGGERHALTTRGRAEVLIPEGHRFGETGASFWTKLRRLDWRDDTLRIQSLASLERGTWFDEIQRAMREAKEQGDAPHALFFLHGFNVSFEEAAIRAAQIGFDLKVPGATAFFS